MRKISKVLFIVLILGLGLVGCNSTSPSQKTNEIKEFNEDKAKEESKAQLEKFLKTYDNKTVIGTTKEMDKVRTFVKDNLFGYMTKDFQNDVMNVLSSKVYNNHYETFYLYDISNNVHFYNDYDIYSPTVDKENKTVVYQLKISPNAKGLTPSSCYVEMKEENGEWKINKTGDTYIKQ